MMKKNHETPEFRVIRQNEANAKFFAGSIGDGGVEGGANGGISGPVTVSLSQTSANGWF